MTHVGGWLHVVAGLMLAGQGPAYVIEEGPPRRFEAELTLKLHAPKLTAQEWILFAPRPPDLPGQTVQASSLQPGGKADRERSAARRPVLKAVVPAVGPALKHGITAVARHEVTLRERRLVEAGKAAKPAPIAVPTAGERKRALAATRMIDFQSPGFRKWLDEHKLRHRAGEHAVDFGRRAFLEVVKHSRYDYRSKMDRRASAVCTAGKSDCGGLSAVFVAALRANGVPARLRVGRWALSQKKNDRLNDVEYAQEHVIAEFFAAGTGWVAADCASGVLHDKSPGRVNFFGHFRPNFITLHVGNDLVLDVAQFGEQTMHWMQGMAYWATGRGDFSGLQERLEWRVRALP